MLELVRITLTVRGCGNEPDDNHEPRRLIDLKRVVPNLIAYFIHYPLERLLSIRVK